jgi:hypothetical protein
MVNNKAKFIMQSDLKGASGTNSTPDTVSNHQDTVKADPHGDDSLHFVNWPWPNAALVALVRSPDADSSISPASHLTFLSPTTLGLAALERSDYFVEGIWLIFTDSGGQPILNGLQIEEISRWSAGSASEQLLTVLHCPKNKLLGIDDQHIFEFQKSATEWNGSGRYKRLDESEI